MRTLLTVLFTALAAYALGLLLPFWSLSLVAFIVGFVMHPGGWRALLAGAIAGAMLWGGLAYMADTGNNSILAARIGMLFTTSATGMVLITALLGGLLAGLAVLVGDRVRNSVS